jgi:asparagine synthase (glutamine-hydrolysing)
MCGISGLINKKGEKCSDAMLEAMNRLIEHRGPDSDGFYYWQNVGLAHRRLSILDLSEEGSQPMHFEMKYSIVYNGEVYNYLEIKEELLGLGYCFRSTTDTEVILAAYDCWGDKCLDRFNGMWSFAILDKSKNELFCSRDRFGVKPFYYTNNEDYFAFGSEIKQLLPLCTSVEADREVLIEFLLTGIDNHSEKTYFRGIFALLPGHWIRISLSDFKSRKHPYYNIYDRVQPNDSGLMDESASLKTMLKSAVSLRLRSDVTVGTCLSGGLDSSAISAIAAKEFVEKTGGKFTAIHARSTETETDESGFAKEVAAHYGMDLHVVTPRTEDFVNLVDEVVYTQEEPFGSPSMFMGYHVFQKAKELGCKVMLNGQGGDEVLLGYERYYTSYLHSMSFSKRIYELVLQAKNSGLSFMNSLLYYLYFSSFKLRKYRLVRESFVKRELVGSHDFKTLRQTANSFKDIYELQKLEVSSIQLPHLLRYEDRNSMRHSIETRLPFLDYRIVEASLGMRPDYKIRSGWTKYVLRISLNGILPDTVIWRKNKLGFNAPEKTWLRHHETKMKEEISKSKLLKELTNLDELLDKFSSLSLKNQWKYYNVAVWERVHNVCSTI